FYDRAQLGGITGTEPSCSPAQALASAQRWLSTATADEILIQLAANNHVTLEDLRTARGDGALSSLGSLPPEARPFADPYHWAGYFYSGV
ncbi:MAG: hypothetical protein ACUVX9_17565, partial [Anaerolineae bacterium]